MKLADMPSGVEVREKLRVLIRHVANYSVKVRILPLQLQAKA
jgi:hypothetical protein